jgi:hypothetical protein
MSSSYIEKGVLRTANGQVFPMDGSQVIEIVEFRGILADSSWFAYEFNGLVYNPCCIPNS